MSNIPANLQPFLKGSKPSGSQPSSDTTPQNAQNATIQGGITGFVSNIISKAKTIAGTAVSDLGGLFGYNPKPAPKVGKTGVTVPANLQQYMTKGVSQKKSQSSGSGKIPSNLSQFVKSAPQKKNLNSQAQPVSGQSSPMGKLFSQSTVASLDTQTETSTPETNDGNNTLTESGTLPAPETDINTRQAAVSSSLRKGLGIDISDQSPAGMVKNFIAATPESTAQVLKQTAQAFPRTAAEIGVSTAQALLAHTNYAGQTPTTVNVPEIDQWFLGAQPIEGMANQVIAISDSIKASPFAIKYGLDKYALPLAFGGVVGGDTLNIAPLGEEADGAIIKELVEADTPEAAAIALRKAGISHEGLVSDLAPKFAELKTTSQVRDGLSVARKLQGVLDMGGDITELNKSNTPENTGVKNEPGILPAAETSPIAETVDANAPTTELPTDSAKTIVESPEQSPELYHGTSAESPIETNPGSGARSIAEQMGLDAPRTPGIYLTDNLDMAKAEGPNTSKITISQSTTNFLTETSRKLNREEVSNLVSAIPGIDTSSVARGVTSGEQLKSDLISTIMSKSNPVEQLASLWTEGYEGQNSDKFIANVSKNGIDGLKFPKTSTGSTEHYLVYNTDLLNSAEAIPAVKGAPKSSPKPDVPPETPLGIQSIKDLMRGKQEELDAKIAANKPDEPAEVKADSGDQLEAYVNATEGDVTSGPFKGWTSETVREFQDFVNRRKPDTVQAVGTVAAKRYESLRPAGIDAILKFEGYELDRDTGHIVKSANGPERKGIYGDIQTANDDFYNAERAAGVPVKYRQNYLRMYLRDPATGEEFVDGQLLGGRQVGRRPSFTQAREFNTYAEAIEAGFQPIYGNIPDIMRQRAMESERAIANGQFFKYLTSTGNAVPKPLLADGAKAGFISFDPDRFPTQQVSYQGKVYSGTFMGPAPVVEKVNGYLKDANAFLKSTAHGFGAIKNFALSIGIPNTGFSVHYWNLLPREVFADMAIDLKTAPKEIAKFLYYGLNTSAAKNYIDQNIENVIPLLRAGMTFSSEEHPLSPLDLTGKTMAGKIGEVGNYVGQFLHNTFSKNIFSRIIPARKLFQAQRMVEFFIKKGMSQEDATRLAAVQTNNLYGGINWEQLGRSKDWQNFMRTILIAPDFAETNINIGKGVLGALFNKTSEDVAGAAINSGSAASKIYRNIAFALVSTYITANLINYEQSGKFMWQNDPLHQLSVAWGKDSTGRTRYINAFGTGTDFLRIPLQVAKSISTGNVNDLIAILRNRLSIPVAAAVSMISNTDWAGQRIYGPDIYGNPQTISKQLLNIANNTVGAALPGSIEETGNVIAGKTSIEQATIQDLGLPIGYVKEQPNTVTIKQLEADAKAGIANGDYTLYNKLVRAGVITSRSRATFIREALTAGGKTAKQLRTSAKDKARVAKEEAALQAEGFNKNSQ